MCNGGKAPRSPTLKLAFDCASAARSTDVVCLACHIINGRNTIGRIMHIMGQFPYLEPNVSELCGTTHKCADCGSKMNYLQLERFLREQNRSHSPVKVLTDGI